MDHNDNLASGDAAVAWDVLDRSNALAAGAAAAAKDAQ